MADSKKPFDFTGFMGRALGPAAAPFVSDPRLLREAERKRHTEAMSKARDEALCTPPGETDRIVRELDAEAYHEIFPMMDKEALLISLHKLRYEMPSIESGLRHESRRWLQERGYTRINSEAWLPMDELP